MPDGNTRNRFKTCLLVGCQWLLFLFLFHMIPIVKLCKVQRIAKVWLPWSPIKLIRHFSKVNILQPCMALDILCSTSKISQTILWPTGKNSEEEVCKYRIDEAGHPVFAFDDGLEQCHLVRSRMTVELLARAHFVDHNCPRPVIASLIMTSSEDNFRSNIPRSSTESESLSFYLFCKSQINEDRISILINHYIFRFQITVKDTMIMHVVQSLQDRR
mmetsp:Transcript_4950/g.7282  ORF Transcript_4950/g.7282 Transcript_4950/m.7282 type:complete len:216 (+) Transcript_4950:130-777(+)